jgi:AcrR family transcriptional regulator
MNSMKKALTVKGAATRARIIEGAATLIRANGPTATNLEDVMGATATSKSQLFHYFPNGRADLLLAVARHEAEQVLAAQQPYLSDLTSVRKWRAWQRAVIAHYGELGESCPLGALTAQLGKSSPATREIVTELYDTWEAHLLAGVKSMQERGQLEGRASARETARGILTAIQGGVLMLQATGRIGYLESALSGALAALHGRKAVAA